MPFPAGRRGLEAPRPPLPADVDVAEWTDDDDQASPAAYTAL